MVANCIGCGRFVHVEEDGWVECSNPNCVEDSYYFPFDDVGSTLLEMGCALTEDERDAFGISDGEYFERMTR